MKIPQLIRSEFARLWATPMARLAFVALMCVPLLYGGLYLWGNQDPYARLSEVPVALVVADEGAADGGPSVADGGDEEAGGAGSGGGDSRSVGEEVAKALVDDGTFDWHRVSAREAARGVEQGVYDFSVTIPRDFTEALDSSDGDAPRQAQVILTTNDANSYLASTIGEQLVQRIQREVVRSVNLESARTLLDGIAEIRASTVEARDGASQLATGAAEALSGAEELEGGAQRAHEGSTALSSGLGTLRDGTAQLPQQSEQLAGGAAEVAAGNAEVAQFGRELAGVSQQAYDGLAAEREAILADLAAAGVDPAVIAAAAERLDGVGAVLGDANTRVQQASGRLDELAAGANEVAGGSRALADAAPELASGIASAAEGAAELDLGLGTLAEGVEDLGSGLGTLADGTGELRDGLASGLERLPDSSAELRERQAANIADPVELRTTDLASAGSYGAGLAPFFVSIAAWIGIYALFLILKPVSRRAVTALDAPVRVAVAGWVIPAMLGAVQMAALYGIVAGSLGFRVAHPLPAYGLMVLASVTFAAIILALNVWLGSVGQFLGLVLMVVQLVAAGGTFPWQTLPAPLAAAHHYLPMSFSVDGLRQLMYGGDLGDAGWDAVRLALVLLVSLLVAVLGVAKMTRSLTLRDLQPSLIG
ncbi:YhgE/Pip family protein [Leucobacter massiliensis]|uniref:ABC-2 type transporter transmembrane domain-containing protein n=1 Tax=Leucobacter massiliensis TaxID=1686285 RepID=A0A2S9QMJ0_9MICO|nr:YhgE/Pip domain-containing protein [Leucobacter massiliensis]PRI10798.1 hypothetical protein B4915_07840 [Leucobacter massiliensis]